MQNKHTPGPWHWHRVFYENHVLTNEQGLEPEKDTKNVIIDDGSCGGDCAPSIDVNGPDARLIAAAPDLLEALQAAHDSYIRKPNCLEGLELGKMMRAAIAKATGEEGGK